MATKEVAVVVFSTDSEVDQYQSLLRAAVMVGGEVGEAVADALSPLHVGVMGREFGHVE